MPSPFFMHDNFEWDEDKAQKNRKKHGVSFDDAALVLSDEDVTTASHPDDRAIVLVIAWTDRSTEYAKVTRIISARAAKPAERKGMSKKSVASKIVRKSAGEIPPASGADLDRLRAAMQGTIDTGEIPERRKFHRLKRDASGNLPPRKSIIREAVARQMQHLHLTTYRLWQLARAHYPTLSQSAVHEFLKGQRQLELPSVEALLAAVHLRVVRKSVARRRRTQHATKQGANRSVP